MRIFCFWKNRPLHFAIICVLGVFCVIASFVDMVTGSFGFCALGVVLAFLSFADAGKAVRDDH